MYSFHNSAVLLDGGEQIATIFTFLFIPLTFFDNRKNHWHIACKQSNNSKLIGHLTFTCISIQTAFIYLNTAIEKIYRLDDWQNGTALYYVFKNSYFGLNSNINSLISPITDTKFIFFITWWVILSHLILSYILLLKRKDKLFYLKFGIIFHGSIAIFIGLYSFSIVMIGVLVLYIIPFEYNFQNTELWKKFTTKRNKYSTYQ